MLESAASDTTRNRFDLLFGFPEESLWLDANGSLHGAASDKQDFLSTLDDAFLSARAGVDTDLPFAGGWFLLLGYELAEQIEPVLSLKKWPGIPVALAVRSKAAVIFDHVSEETIIVCESDAADLLSRIEDDLQASERIKLDEPDSPVLVDACVEEPSATYLEAVEAALEYIYEGDVFQANLARCWTGMLSRSWTPALLYRRLRRCNPAPFAGLLVWADMAVISSSPERLLRLSDGVAETRPIAGTRPRGRHDAQDRALSEELIAHPKERAEHTMLIDLERNDLGRICRGGTVEVDEWMVLESYAHVHHIVSNVRGLLRNDVTPGVAIRALFPGGTITGCPKVRCMEIISKLEKSPRGPYTGAMGYLDRRGHLDLNILIRTLTVQGNTVKLHAGAGIVADSVPQNELEETRAKARGLLRALDAA